MDYIREELLVLVAVMNVIGYFLKQSRAFDDRMIPLVLGAMSVVLTMLYVGIMVAFTLQGLMTSFVQGVLIAGAAVYGNQLIKQPNKPD
jgi:hypothetical protein